MTFNNTQTRLANRSSVSLNGRWDFRPDRDDTGVEEQWQSTTTWPDADRQSVSVPHAWQENESLTDYTGIAWYRRTVEFDTLPHGGRLFLRFNAVDYHTTVWVNGVECGTNRGGYLPFEVDATEAFEAGQNVVTIRVEDPDDLSQIPHGKQGDPWYRRVSGIWQDVSVEFRPAIRVSDARVTPNLEDDIAHIEFTAIADDIAPDGSLTATVRVSHEGTTVNSVECDVSLGNPTVESVSIPNAEYWHPENPVLYDLEIELEDDSGSTDVYEDYFGMRSIRVENGTFHLNGEPLYIRGALDQGYYPETLYRPSEEDLFEHEIRTAKELGFNLLRKHIKPAHPDFIELADRMGILVWEEPANPSQYTDRSKREVQEQLRDLINRDFNRPSVIIWSLYNEEWGIGHHQDEPFIWDDEEKQAYLSELYEAAKRWDPTRLVCDNSGWAHVATDINDYHRYFASPDRAAAWGDDLDNMTAHPEGNYAATYTDPETTPVVVSEFGTWGLADTEALEEFYGQEPEWYHHPFLTPVDGPTNERQVHLESNLRSPAGFKKRYDETTLPEKFDGLAELAETWQWREYLSVKNLIEQMRVHDGLSGYIITEFTDIEWEFNGILDYRREEKVFHDEFASVNNSLFVAVDPEHHAVWSGDELSVDITVVNDGRVSHSGIVEWKLIDDESGETVDSGELDVGVDAHAKSRTRTVPVTIPDVDKNERQTLQVTFTAETATATNEEPISVVQPARAPNRDITVFAQENYIADRLIGSCYKVTRELNDDVDLAVVSTLDVPARNFAEAGGRVLLLPPPHETTPIDDLFEYRELPEGENWNLCSALYAHNSPFIGDLTGSKRLDWAFEGIYPNALATGLDTDHDEIYVEYVEGWIANWGSPLVIRSVGNGQVCTSTFPLGEAYGEQPVGTLLLDHLIDHISRD
ncbi:beta-galactosidase [Haladaptatus sp. W1]|uniref:glycoside hydrolase family 2 protein n=1 Tax=Haladaptatus sp. W1 TaxID=1897478 RepID=UPI0008498D4F|nr:sugar-binding domain-containing protein [Haladaptatus sp. W1]ODR80367.1 beta-galactosidase [Haladaptatus sp. W1]